MSDIDEINRRSMERREAKIISEQAARIEQLEAALLGEETEHSRRIMEVDRLRAALRDIEENSFSIYARDIARAALEDRT